MIDFVKVNNLPVSVKEILEHDQLTFPLSNVATTGELLDRAQVAHYGAMSFIVKGKHVKVKGSLHKHAHNGKNYSDLTFADIHKVVDELSQKFRMSPNDAIFNFIEIGVNIKVSIDPTVLIKNFLFYRHKVFEPFPITGAGFGRQCKLQQMTIKVYNKSLQEGLADHLLRFEVKVTRMEFLKTYGIEKLTLKDLTTPEVYSKFLTMLLNVFDQIQFFNPEFDTNSITNAKDRELVSHGKYPQYWSDLSRQRKNERIKRFNELTGTNNLKKKLSEDISAKWDKLMNPDKLTTLARCVEGTTADKLTTFRYRGKCIAPDKLTTLQDSRSILNDEKTGQINTAINRYKVTCPITNIDISMQKQNSHLLSNTGLKWLKQNDPVKYEEIKRRFLPRKGVSGIHTKHEEDEIKHLSKQIRNEHYNPRKNRSHTPENQLACFEL